MDPFVSAIYLFAGNFAIRGFALCQGQLLTIQSNTALFSLLGTYYGGDGRSTFGLPDLRGNAAVAFGQGPGLSQYFIGETTGTETVTMDKTQLPAHNHLINASSAVGTTESPSGAVLAKGPTTGTGPGATAEKFYNAAAPNVVMSNLAVSSAGGSQPFSIMQPVLTLNYIIALQGIYPARN